MRHLVFTALGLSIGLGLAISTLPKPATADVPTLGVDQIKPGMKGYGLTVFSGTEPEKFDVEVINVLHKFRPNQDLILVKTIHPRLEKVKVVAGMSGSPIFLSDGGTAKLVGAYAYGWAFGNEPIAGVTPIATMMGELARPLSPMLLPSPGGKSPIGPITPPGGKKKTAGLDPSDSGSTAWTGDVGTYSLDKHVTEVASRLKGTPGRGGVGSPSLMPTMVDTPLMVGGMSDRAVRELGSLLSPLGLIPLQAGGAGLAAPAKDAPTHFVDGGAIAVQLMRGDAASQATGTVTHVIGKKVLAFGHPMMEVGSAHLPTAIAKILWFLSSDQRSFKISEPVRSLGTMIQDRESCIIADEDIVAPTIPMSIELFGDPTAPKKKWNMEIVHDRFMTPMWTSYAVGDAIGVTLNDRRDVSWTSTATIAVKGKGTLKFSDFGVSGSGLPGGATFFASRAGLAVGELLNNPWENVTIERIETSVTVAWGRDTVRLRGAELVDNPVEAGGTARIRLTLKPYFGAEYTVIGSIKIDPGLAGKEVDLEVLPGWLITQESAAPESLDQLVKNLQLPTLAPKSYVIQYRHPEHGLALKGKVASRLPLFAVDAFKSTSSTITAESFAPMVRSHIDVPAYSEGSSRVRLTVKAASK